jgi:hypothetical protein
MLGRLDDADRARTLLLKADPKLTVAGICDFYALRRAGDRQRLTLALRKAGLPE